MDRIERLLVGIDFSKSRADLALLRSDGQPIEVHRTFANSLPGFEQAKELLVEVLAENSFQGVDIAGEATNYYWLPYFLQLAQDPALAAYDPNLFLLNARWVHWYKKSLSPDHKDDATDPQYIADRLRHKRPPTPWKVDPKWMPLRFYTRLRCHLLKSQTRAKNLCQVYLFLAYNTYARYQPFSDLFSVTSQRLLRQPELLESLADLSLDEAAAVLHELSGHHLPDPHKNAQALQRVLAESFPQDERLATAIQTALEILLDTLNSLQAQIKRVEDLIGQQVQAGYPEVGWLDSIPGIGLVLASGVATEIGDIRRFSEVPKWDKVRKCQRSRRPGEVEDAIAKYAGLWWPKNASGQFEAEERRMNRAGNPYLRYYLIEAGENLRQWLPRFAVYYQKKFDGAVKHKHKRAKVLTGRKALGLFVGLLLRQETYQAKEGNRPNA